MNAHLKAWICTYVRCNKYSCGVCANVCTGVCAGVCTGVFVVDEQSHPIIAWLRVLKRSGKRSCHLIDSDVGTFPVNPKLLSWPLLTIKSEMNCVCVSGEGGLHVHSLYVCCMYCMCV